jgi:hypothetical protein
MDRQAEENKETTAAAAVTAQNTLNAIERQVINLRRQAIWLRQSAKAARLGAQAAVTNATAAKMSAEAAKTSADIAAGVSIPTLVIEKFEHGNTGAANLAAILQYPKINIAIKNYGQTPALLKFWSIIFTCEDLPASPSYWNHPGSGIILERVAVEPNESYTLPDLNSWRRTELSLEDVQAIINHKKKLWAYGFICYDDIFGNTRRRLKFCELALNFTDGWIQWASDFCPAAYRGTEAFPFGQAASGDGTESRNIDNADQNPN